MKRRVWSIVAICLVCGLAFVYYGSNYLEPRVDNIVTVSQALQSRSAPAPKLEFPCNNNAADAMARAYSLAIPVNGATFSFTIDESSPLTKYVRTHREMFTRDGSAIRCAAALGQHVISLGLETLRANQDIYDGVINRWGGQAPDVAASVALELKNRGSDMYSIGSELVWLSRVLPAVAESSYSSFNEAYSEPRQTLKQYLPLFGTTIGMSGERDLFRQVYGQIKEQYSPDTENALIILASALPRS